MGNYQVKSENLIFDSEIEAVMWILANRFTTRYYENMTVTKKVKLAENLINKC